MDICVATDENYISLVRVLITSIFENNRQENIVIHIFADKVSKISKEGLLKIAEKYSQKILFYDAEIALNKIRTKISNEWADNNSYSTYIRIFMCEMLDDTVKIFLYLDCDTLVNGNIAEIFKIDMTDYYAAAVKDVLPTFYKKSIGLEDSSYFNAGVMLINAELWREDDIGSKIIQFCLEHSDCLYPDQDAINIVLKDRIFIMQPKYCVFYPEYSFTVEKQWSGYGSMTEFYNREEILDAQRNPVIIHYVDSVLGRPWYINNINPYSETWMKYYEMLDDSMKFEFMNKTISRNQKIFRKIYKIFPRSIFGSLYYFRRNKGLQGRIDRLEEPRC